MPLYFHLRSHRRRHALTFVAVLALLALIAFGILGLRSRGSTSDPGPAASAPQAASASTSEAPRLPTAAEQHGAALFAAKRQGLVSFAAIDTSGALRCYRCRLRYHAASIVKAMLLVGYLNRMAEENKALPADHEAYLSSMIRVSDNDAASAIYADVGDEGLHELARKAQMTDFRVSGSWGSALITAADQAGFFAQLPELTAPRYQEFVRALLSSIVQEQSWGIPQVSRPEWKTFFKGGWLMSRRGNLVHQVARLEKGTATLAIAILTDENPSDLYGRETIRGIARRLLGRDQAPKSRDGACELALSRWSSASPAGNHL